MMEKILYEQQVDWDWIKQRPQFLAESLSDSFEMHVFYRTYFHRTGLQSNSHAENVTLHPFQTLPPLRDRFYPLTAVNAAIRRHRFSLLLRQLQPEWIWLNYPSQIEDVPDGYTGKVVYDCMDDYLELDCPAALRPKLQAQEESICKRANLIFSSSAALQDHLTANYQLPQGRIQVIRNGCKNSSMRFVERVPSGDKRFCIGYIGTISEWFDFSLILKSLDHFQNLEYGLVGPVCVKNPPVHPRLHYYGTVAHEDLWQYVQGFDCLAMPFLDVPLVRAVDPVKLYEYIGFYRSILCLDYPEVARFAPFVHFYRGEREYCDEIAFLMQRPEPNYSQLQAEMFLKKNTWEVRASDISAKMHAIADPGHHCWR